MCVYVQSDQVFFFLRLLTMVIGEVCNLIGVCRESVCLLSNDTYIQIFFFDFFFFWFVFFFFF